ncbi:MAG: DUF4105 domain-containing protein [Saprospiraceae bacterium]|nr:DUF4105 domain-containing protein [Saprospiraceae bacterium]
MKHFFLILYIFLLNGVSHSQEQNLDKIEISLLTCRPGSEIYSMYGHNAIRINNTVTGNDYVFNYGTFDFNTPGFVIKFMRGKLPYLLSVARYDQFLYEYNYLERDVYEQVLNPDSLEKMRIINYLEKNYLPENRAYAYDFFYDNCATRLRDVLNIGFGENLHWNQSNASGKTFREIIKEYQSVMPWIDFGVDLIIGAKADKVTSLAEEAFIPDYLMNAVLDASLTTETGKRPLAQETRLVLSFQTMEKSSFIKFLFGPEGILSILFFVILITLVKPEKFSSKAIQYFDTFWIWLMSIMGLFMLVMWFGTDHQATKNNWNILWANPLLLILIPDWLSRKAKLILAYILLSLIGISILNSMSFIQILPQYFNPVFIPICLISYVVLYRNFIMTKKS